MQDCWKPAVVITQCKGCARDPEADFSTFQTDAFGCARNSPPKPVLTFNPSSDFDSAANGSNLLNDFRSVNDLSSTRNMPRSTGSCRTMRLASSNNSRDWSRFVAAEYTSAPCSLSPTSPYKPALASSVVFPFFRAMSSYTVRNRRVPSARSQP